ncbi:MAG: BrnT family toxin [Zoogloeaceae bacterium]|jgi:uncharacterized DUF497 family protein|nr:BrnT family toxin [Zoogloeaceae bacterium]
MNFVWDPAKAAANIRKHGVPFEEAVSVFLDVLSITGADPDHSEGESRWLIFGLSSFGRLLVVSHTEDYDTVRIISARPCTSVERKLYEKS